jgi:ribulose-bisphosphate carboxylase large chain
LNDRFRITYSLTCGEGEQASSLAREIALEQTVELPERCLSKEIAQRVVGRVEELEAVEGRRWRTVISYSAKTVGNDLSQFLNLLFGNISLKRGILVTGVAWPESWLGNFQGPAFGIEGIRRLCGVAERRPLLCAALKPLGLSAAELARACSGFAEAGVDIIKEDHGLADQPYAPFEDRLERCLEAIARCGGDSLYFPNITGDSSRIEERLEMARDAGCRGVLVSPLLVGADMARHVAQRSGLAILAHPSMSGAYFHDDHGIAPELLLGEIFRIIGSDGVIFPNAGGRFPFSEESCRAISSRLRRPLGRLRPSCPVPAGGIDAKMVAHWAGIYGADTIFLIGGSLYAEPDVVAASRRLLDELKAAFA